MTEYKDQYDDYNVVCPYCGYKYHPEDQAVLKDNEVEECNRCGKKYNIYKVYSVEYTTQPNCSLNNLEHKYTKAENENFCKTCGEPMDQDDDAEKIRTN